MKVSFRFSPNSKKKITFENLTFAINPELYRGFDLIKNHRYYASDGRCLITENTKKRKYTVVNLSTLPIVEFNANGKIYLIFRREPNYQLIFEIEFEDVSKLFEFCEKIKSDYSPISCLSNAFEILKIFYHHGISLHHSAFGMMIGKEKRMVICCRIDNYTVWLGREQITNSNNEISKSLSLIKGRLRNDYIHLEKEKNTSFQEGDGLFRFVCGILPR